jgi:hypothetical protein
VARRNEIKVSELFKPVPVDIFGAKFKLRQATRSTEEKVQAAEEAIEEAQKRVNDEELNEQESRAQLLPLLYEMFDILLEAEGKRKDSLEAQRQFHEAELNRIKNELKRLKDSDEEGSAETGSEVLARLYEADQIGLGHIEGLSASLIERTAERPI